MAKTIDIYLPASVVTYKEGSAGCTSISVKSYWGNIVIAKIYFTPNPSIEYFAVPVKIYDS
jgi:hypothetical protein